MTCDSVSKLIPLYFYGELTPDEEDRVEQHLDACAACSREMDAAARAGGGVRQPAGGRSAACCWRVAGPT